MNYRAVAKALKPVLDELSQRNLSNLKNNPKAHEEAKEYPIVKEGLHQHFEHRLAWIQEQKNLNKKRLSDILEHETAMRKQQYNVSFSFSKLTVVTTNQSIEYCSEHARDADHPFEA